MGYNVEDSSCVSENVTCTFSIVNGSILTGIGIIGTGLSIFTIYCLIYHVKLPYNQNLFLLNVAVSDVIMAISATVRGLGIISPFFVGFDEETNTANWWCHTYAFLGNTLWMSAIPVLVPLTIDRFIAIVFPMQYRSFMTRSTCKIMIAFTWLPLLVILLYDTVTLSNGSNKILYQKNYHRCVFEGSRSWKKAIYVLFPFVTIILMYATMCLFVRKAGMETKKLLIISSLIIATGLITHIPDQLLITFHVHMPYEVAQVTTVTLYYTNSIWNPIIYFCSNRITQQKLAATPVGKKISEASTVIARKISNINDIRRKSVFSSETMSDLEETAQTETPRTEQIHLNIIDSRYE